MDSDFKEAAAAQDHVEGGAGQQQDRWPGLHESRAPDAADFPDSSCSACVGSGCLEPRSLSALVGLVQVG